MLHRQQSRINKLKTKIEAKKSNELNRMREEITKLNQERDEVQVNHDTKLKEIGEKQESLNLQFNQLIEDCQTAKAALQSKVLNLTEKLKESEDSLSACQVMQIIFFNLERFYPKCKSLIMGLYHQGRIKIIVR